MKINILSILAASFLLSACGSNSDGTYNTNGYGTNGSTNSDGTTNNGSNNSAGGSSKNNTPTVPESVLPVNVSNAPKGPAAYAIFENLNNPQDIQNSKENFTKSQLSKKLQQPVYSSPKASTTIQSEGSK